MVESLVKKHINEYVTNDELYLRDYLTLSDEQKIEYLPKEYTYFIDRFIYEDYDYESLEIPRDYEHYEIVDWLEENNKEVYLEYGKWLLEKINKFGLDIHESDYPAWAYFDDSPSIVKNDWLIHFTSKGASHIAKEGFKYGINDYTKLGLTTSMGDIEKEFGGYNFAYTIDDFERYAYAGNQEYKYGDEAVLFRASGIRTYHFGDEEYQTIFYGNTATNIIPILEGETLRWGVYNKKGYRLIYESDNLEKVVNWIIKNYDQYRKQLF